MTKIEFEKKIYDRVKLGFTNYNITEEEINTLTNIVYEDIASEINLMNAIQCVKIEDNKHIYDLDHYIVKDAENYSVIGDTYKIVDEDNIDVGWYFTESCQDTFEIKPMQRCNFWSCYADHFIHFYRHTIPNIEVLTNDVQIAIQSALIEGIKERLVEIYPAPIGSQVPLGEEQQKTTNYESAKYKLLNKYPQYR